MSLWPKFFLGLLSQSSVSLSLGVCPNFFTVSSPRSRKRLATNNFHFHFVAYQNTWTQTQIRKIEIKHKSSSRTLQNSNKRTEERVPQKEIISQKTSTKVRFSHSLCPKYLKFFRCKKNFSQVGLKCAQKQFRPSWM